MAHLQLSCSGEFNATGHRMHCSKQVNAIGLSACSRSPLPRFHDYAGCKGGDLGVRDAARHRLGKAKKPRVLEVLAFFIAVDNLKASETMWNKFVKEAVKAAGDIKYLFIGWSGGTAM